MYVIHEKTNDFFRSPYAEEKIIINRFKTLWGARLWKFFNYDLCAEPGFKGTFIWTIEKED